MSTAEPTHTLERDEHVLLIALNRPPKRKAFTLDCSPRSPAPTRS